MSTVSAFGRGRSENWVRPCESTHLYTAADAADVAKRIDQRKADHGRRIEESTARLNGKVAPHRGATLERVGEGPRLEAIVEVEFDWVRRHA